MKSLVGIGHLKKSDVQGAKAWLQGKLLVAFLIEALISAGERFFPPGDTPSPKPRRHNRCLWRETSLMRHLLSMGVNPALSLVQCPHDWDDIAKRLQEPRRKRSRQVDRLASDLVCI